MDESNSNDDTEKDIESMKEMKLNTHVTTEKSMVSRSILGVLENKNRVIAVLKKQIQNQKVQLQFHLHKSLGGPKIIEMSKDCVPVEAEENIAVNLALVKFCNQRGLKSRIASLHHRMHLVETQILRLVDDQDIVIEKLSKSITTNHQKDEIEECAILKQILDTTRVLRSELEAFRTCCNRLMVIEDERNSLVEQVYSVPESERINYNALLAILHEKTRLEKEIIEIKQFQKQLLVRLNTVNAAPQNQDRKSSTAQTQMEVEKEKNEIIRLKDINSTLTQKLNFMEQDKDCKKIIENKMEKVIVEYQHFRENAAKQMSELNCKLGSVIEENEKLSEMLRHYKEIEAEVNSLRSRLSNIECLQREKNHYKTQFEELQTIRETYAEIVQKPFKSLRDADKLIMQQKRQIHILDAQLIEKKTEVRHLEMVIEEKNVEIKELSEIVDVHEENKRKELMMVNNSANTPMKFFKDVGCNYNLKSSSPKRLIVGEPESDLFLRLNESTNKQSYSKAVPVTTLKVCSINSKGLTETLRAVVESTSPVEGILQLTNNSAFTVRLTCGSQMENQNLAHSNPNDMQVNCTNLTNAFKCSTIVMDEFELMKDSSNEALIARMSSFHSIDQAKLREQRHLADKQKCEKITIHSIYEPETLREGSDTITSDVSDVGLIEGEEEEENDNSIGEGNVTFKGRLKKIVDNSLCRHVFEKLFSDETDTDKS
ncbi:hypothetical protein FQR65_LT11112 [Abscondita terminalis]|nr:hypothetical protein FQR65_LT11112 [Abscondita terminalis]